MWGMVQCLTLLGMYGLILFKASNMLSDGSEMLLLVPSLAGIVRTVASLATRVPDHLDGLLLPTRPLPRSAARLLVRVLSC
jgi:hypothetical protein